MHKVTFTYHEGTYVVEWDAVECVWNGEDEQVFDTLDEIRTDMMHSGCENITEKHEY